MGQLEGERPSVWVEVSIHSRDVDGIWLWLLAYLSLLREHLRCIIVDIQEVDLQGAGAACWRFAYVKYQNQMRSAYTYLWESWLILL